MSRGGGERRGNISEMRFSTQGSDTGSHGGGRRDSLLAEPLTQEVPMIKL